MGPGIGAGDERGRCGDSAPRAPPTALYCTAEDLDDFLARAIKQRWSSQKLLEELVRQELAERERRSPERRLLHAWLGRFKAIADFDWSWPTKIDRHVAQQPQVLALPRLDHVLI